MKKIIRQTKKEILCTLGPSSMNEWTIRRMEDLGVNLFRINLSHTKLRDLAARISYIQRHASVPVCLDTEGAQIRTGELSKGKIILKENSLIRILRKPVTGNVETINLYPCEIIDELIIGDFISIDFNSVLVQVKEKTHHALVARVITGGVLGQNKAVSVDREIVMPALTQKDQKALLIGKKMGIRHVALSFANKAADVDFLRSLTGKGTFIISKIESISGVDHLEKIAAKSDAVLIDRGDLSRQLPIEQIPRIQKNIIRRAKNSGTKVYVATNLLESMTKVSTPTRAEVNDVFNTLNDGADGLVLAAETAIGSYPLNCVMMVSKVMREFEEFSAGVSLPVDELKRKHSLLLVEPHGGTLVDRMMMNADVDQISRYKKLKVDPTILLDAEQIAIGTFSPLEGFMTRKELQSVLDTYRLPNKIVWPIPVVLQTQEKDALAFRKGDRVALCQQQNGEVYAILHVEDVYTFDLDKLCRATFHTNDEKHPGVQLFKRRGRYFLGGKIDLIKRLPSAHKPFEITPRQARMVFENKCWSRVIGFHTRNVAHRAHEHIQLLAFKANHCDGIFIHPLIGPKKKGDYNAEIILKSYELLTKKYYPKGKTLLAAFQNYSRYSGPREAVFTALCRKNFGCSHFIVGRDHTGVSNYYAPDSAHKLFRELGDIGIKLVFFNTFHYCRKCREYVDSCRHRQSDILNISGTQGREMIQSKKTPPAWFMRKDISSLILNEIEEGKEVFVA